MEVFVTGANGRLGRAVLKKLESCGVSATPLVRRRCHLKNEVVTNFEVEDLKKQLKNAKVVLHIAGSTKFNDKKSLWEGNVNLTENIVNSLSNNVKIVFAGSISVYGRNPPYMANEETELNPDNEYARTKAIAEEIVKSHKNYVILRIGTIYGIQYKTYQKMLSIISKGIVPIIGSGENRIPFVHIDDVADCFINSLNAKGIYVVCGKSERQRDIMIYTAKLLRNRFLVLRIPLKLVDLCSSVFNIKEHVKVLTSDRVFNTKKAEKDLKFRPRSVWDGIYEVVEEWRKRNNKR